MFGCPGFIGSDVLASDFFLIIDRRSFGSTPPGSRFTEPRRDRFLAGTIELRRLPRQNEVRLDVDPPLSFNRSKSYRENSKIPDTSPSGVLIVVVIVKPSLSSDAS